MPENGKLKDGGGSMEQRKRRPRTGEVSWPVGPDATYPEPVTDPQGSYTGRPETPGEIPVQDADDL